MSPKSGLVYEPFLALIGASRPAYAPDTPGFGASDPPPEPPGIEDYAETMLAFCDRLGLGELDLMGYHTGSKIAVELARRAPDRVRRLVLVSAPVYTEAELEVARRTFAARPPAEDGSHLTEAWRSLRRWRGPHQSLEHMQAMFVEGLRGGRHAHWGHRAAFDYPLGERLPEVKSPVLVLRPGDDLWTETARAGPLLPEGAVLDLPGWGHGFLDGCTAEAVALVTAFLDEGRVAEVPASARAG
jgi:pimeloyl-ACP methyl ester carboxylesterase